MERAIPILPIDNPEEAKRFYVECLGLSLVFEAHCRDEPQAGIIIGVERGTIRIHLDCPMPGHGRDACVCLDAADADASYGEWRTRVTLRKAPEDQPWGARTSDVMDPFGNTLVVAAPAIERRA